MKVIVSIVSHGHQGQIIEGGILSALNGLDIILRENQPEACRQIKDQAVYFHNLRCNGFGTNHNKSFETTDLEDEDWFVICNPDILTDKTRILNLVMQADSDGEKIATPYLFNERAHEFDHNVRRWPTFFRLLRSFLNLGGKSRYTEHELKDLEYPDWCSGALLAIKAGTFRELGGFDESFFMYMEDVDLCMRAAQKGVKIRFYNEIMMIHNAARSSGSLFSTSFVLHLSSAIRYFCKHLRS